MCHIFGFARQKASMNLHGPTLRTWDRKWKTSGMRKHIHKQFQMASERHAVTD